MQSIGLLSEALEVGGNYCKRVVDMAVEAANSAVFLSLDAAERLGQSLAVFLENDLMVAADTACNAAYRGMQALLEGEEAGLDSSDTLDLSAAASEDPKGTPHHNLSNLL